MGKVLVLGATGNLGAYSAIALKDAGFDVVATGKRKSDNGFFQEKGITYYSIDITDPASFDILKDENISIVADFAGELPSRCAYNAYCEGERTLLRSETDAERYHRTD